MKTYIRRQQQQVIKQKEPLQKYRLGIILFEHNSIFSVMFTFFEVLRNTH